MNTITRLNRLIATASARVPRLYAAARITAAFALAVLMTACSPHH